MTISFFFRVDNQFPLRLSTGYWPIVAMLLHNLLHRPLCCHQALLRRCIQTLPRDGTRTLHSPTVHFLRQQPFLFCQSRGIKNRNRKFHGQEDEWKTRNKTVLTYITAAGIGMIGLAYAAVPLYRLYCQVSRTSSCSGWFHYLQNGGMMQCTCLVYMCGSTIKLLYDQDILAGLHSLWEKLLDEDLSCKDNGQWFFFMGGHRLSCSWHYRPIKFLKMNIGKFRYGRRSGGYYENNPRLYYTWWRHQTAL